MTLKQVIQGFTWIGIIGSLILAGAVTYEYFDSSSIYPNIVEIIAFCLILPGFAASYLVQAERLGRLGFIAFVVLTTGYIFCLGLNWSVAFVSPIYGDLGITNTVNATSPPYPLFQGMESSFLALNVGLLLYGIALLRSGIFAKWSGILFLLSIPAGLAPPIDDKNTYFFSAAMIWILLASWRHDPVKQMTRKVVRRLIATGLFGSIVKLIALTWLYVQPDSIGLHAAALIGSSLILLGLFALYITQANRLGRFGFIASIALITGAQLAFGINWCGTFIAPIHPELIPAEAVPEPANHIFPFIQGMAGSFIAFNAGLLLYGIALLRFGKHAKWAGILYLLSIIALLAPPMDDKWYYFFCASIVLTSLKAWHWSSAESAGFETEQHGEPDIGQQQTVPLP
ncbi:hypothetical protein [Paenibacillus sp. OV219]|uniref:hypothetical protein n=1 Tax=Paenibacillus sp. OV219 TaxID=1884377 RepID=UPI0008CA9B14|nr:hypothetical protein [Paenibacillus sp. OV219]SEN55920.1 hypothetical protein SAMN05518847_103201 [Paenibacillus sp. OV219]